MKITDLETQLLIQQQHQYRYARSTANQYRSSWQATPSVYSYKPSKNRTHADTSRQSVDDLIGDGSLFVLPTDPVTAMLGDKLHTSWLAVDDTILQIQRRYDLYRQHMAELEDNRLSTLNLMHTFPKFLERVSPENYQSIHSMLCDIDHQQRDERISFWRDVSRLRQGLPELAGMYLSGIRKMQIMDQADGGHA